MNNAIQKRNVVQRCTMAAILVIAALTEASVWGEDTVPPDPDVAAEIRAQGIQAVNDMALENTGACFWQLRLEQSLQEHLAAYADSRVRLASNDTCPCDMTNSNQ